MLTIGLTGGIGSGKTTVADKFATLGIELVDADLLSREVVAPGTAALQEIASRFGDSILTSQGELDRKALRKIVFNNPEQRQWLEQLLHPAIAKLIKTRLQNCKSSYCILVSPLLLETKQHEFVDRILVVDVPEDLQLERAMLRDGSDESTIRGIIEAQVDRATRLKTADDTIDNSLPLDSLDRQVIKLHNHYLELAKTHERT